MSIPGVIGPYVDKILTINGVSAKEAAKSIAYQTLQNMKKGGNFERHILEKFSKDMGFFWPIIVSDYDNELREKYGMDFNTIKKPADLREYSAQARHLLGFDQNTWRELLKKTKPIGTVDLVRQVELTREAFGPGTPEPSKWPQNWRYYLRVQLDGVWSRKRRSEGGVHCIIVTEGPLHQPSCLFPLRNRDRTCVNSDVFWPWGEPGGPPGVFRGLTGIHTFHALLLDEDVGALKFRDAAFGARIRSDDPEQRLHALDELSSWISYKNKNSWALFASTIDVVLPELKTPRQ